MSTTMRRTRAGCEVCKRRHVKCDEQKPACGHCLRRGEMCIYNPPKAWVFEPQRPRPIAPALQPPAGPDVGSAAMDASAAAAASAAPAALSSPSASPDKLSSEPGSAVLPNGMPSTLLTFLGGSRDGAATFLPDMPQKEILLAYFVEACCIASSAVQNLATVDPDLTAYYFHLDRAFELIDAANAPFDEASFVLCNTVIGTAEFARTGETGILRQLSKKNCNTLKAWKDAGSTRLMKHEKPPHMAHSVRSYAMSVLRDVQHELSLPTPFADTVGFDMLNQLYLEGTACKFDDLAQATDSLHSIILVCVLALVRTSGTPLTAGPTQQSTQEMLDVWIHTFSRLEFSGDVATGPDSLRLCKSLSLHWTICSIISASLLQDSEYAFTSHQARFECVVGDLEYLVQEDTDQAQFRGLYAPLNLIPAAFLTATKCRDPLVRRRALEILRQCNINDGAWNGQTAYHIASMIISIEEDLPLCMAGGSTAGSVFPIRAESAHFALDSATKKGTITLRYSNPADPSAGTMSRHRHFTDEQTLRALCSSLWPLDPTLRSCGYIRTNLIPTRPQSVQVQEEAIVMDHFHLPWAGYNTLDPSDSA